MPPSREPTRCPVCNRPLAHSSSVGRHMLRYHRTEWANSNPGKQITLYPCDQPGCNALAGNAKPNIYVAHLSRVHGIDSPSMRRTTDDWYLQSKNVDVLHRHIIQEATELNELNRRIRDIEHCFALDPPAGGYTSGHGFDVTTNFTASLELLSYKKALLVAQLQRIRNTRNKVGSLYTRPGVMDTRDGVYDDLRSLLDTPDGPGSDELEVFLDASDHSFDNAGSVNASSENARSDYHGSVNPGRDSPKPLSISTLTPEEAFALLRQESAQGWWARITEMKM